MSKIILLSRFPLPYGKIGSWTTLYNNYLQSDTQMIDVVICPEPHLYYKNIKYSIVRQQTIADKINAKFFKKVKNEYLRATDNVVCIGEKYIFQIVDNYGMVKPLHDFLKKRGIRKQCYIQFFYHGFDPYEQLNSNENFYSILDELIYLTHFSREQFIRRIPNLPKYSSVLHNGIDTTQFRSVSKNEIVEIKKQLNIDSDNVFVWCSQDRPKKGLDLILEVWREVFTPDRNIILLVIGCEPKHPVEGVRYLGKIPNSELAKYYQIADSYLFPTLCNEGFGMSLIEALHCGCYCIASNLGGVAEVLENGKYGVLIDSPTNVSSWIDAIINFLEFDKRYPKIPPTLYSMDMWNRKMNKITSIARERLLHI